MFTTMVAGIGCNGAVRRIRAPNPQDVLSGRGGGINSHPGNKAYREWVRLRKEAYNLAVSKKEKTEVAMQVLRQVKQQDPPGRFLQKDPTAVRSGGHWWVEIDDSKALAKTTQALREGASRIRESHHLHGEANQQIPSAVKQENGNTKKRKRIIEEACSPTAVISMSATGAPARETTEIKLDASFLSPHPEKLLLPPPDSMIEPDVPFLSQEPEKMILPPPDYKMAIEKLQENVAEAKHLAEQEHDQQVEKEHPRSLVAPLTSNKAFNERYRHNYSNSTKTPIVSRPQLPNCDGSTTDIAASATTWNKQFNLLAIPDIDFFADTPYLNAYDPVFLSEKNDIFPLNEVPVPAPV